MDEQAIHNLAPEELAKLLYIGVKGLNGDPDCSFRDMGESSKELIVACVKEIQQRIERRPALAARSCFAPIVTGLAAMEGDVYDPKKVASALDSLSRKGVSVVKEEALPVPQINPFRSFRPD